MEKRLSLVLLLVLALWPISCSKHFDDSVVELSGAAQAGRISSATVTIYQIENGARGTPLGTSTTDSEGNFTVFIASTENPIEVVVTYGSYLDEATGQTVTLQTGEELTSVAESASTSLALPVTPITTQLRERVFANLNSGTDFTTVKNAALQEIAQVWGLPSSAILAIPTPPSQAIDSQTDAGKSAFVLASLSQYMKNSGQSPLTGVSPLTFLSKLNQDFAKDGKLDGKDNETSLDASITSFSTSWNSGFTTAKSDIKANPNAPTFAAFDTTQVGTPTATPDIKIANSTSGSGSSSGSSGGSGSSGEGGSSASGLISASEQYSLNCEVDNFSGYVAGGERLVTSTYQNPTLSTHVRSLSVNLSNPSLTAWGSKQELISATNDNVQMGVISSNGTMYFTTADLNGYSALHRLESTATELSGSVAVPDNRFWTAFVTTVGGGPALIWEKDVIRGIYSVSGFMSSSVFCDGGVCDNGSSTSTISVLNPANSEYYPPNPYPTATVIDIAAETRAGSKQVIIQNLVDNTMNALVYDVRTGGSPSALTIPGADQFAFPKLRYVPETSTYYLYFKPSNPAPMAAAAEPTWRICTLIGTSCNTTSMHLNELPTADFGSGGESATSVTIEQIIAVPKSTSSYGTYALVQALYNGKSVYYATRLPYVSGVSTFTRLTHSSHHYATEIQSYVTENVSTLFYTKNNVNSNGPELYFREIQEQGGTLTLGNLSAVLDTAAMNSAANVMAVGYLRYMSDTAAGPLRAFAMVGPSGSYRRTCILQTQSEYQ